MRTAGVIALASVALVAPAWSQDVYRWQDGSGQVHYSNTPPAEQGVRRLGEPLPYEASPPDAPAAEAARETADTAPEAVAPDDTGDDGADAPVAGVTGDQAEAVSASASLRRNALERDLRATEKRLREVEAELRTLAGQRTRFAAGSEATGGVRTSAIDLRSEEEKALEEERDQLSQHAIEVRTAAAKLREEVSAKLGGAPDWWVDVR